MDFNTALRGVNFDPAGDHNGAQGENGIPEGFEMALIAGVLRNPQLDLRPQGGIHHGAVLEAFEQAREGAGADARALSLMWPTTPDVIAAYSLLGKDSHAAIGRMTASFGAALDSDYSLALALDPFLSAEGDADGDGFTNRQEYYAYGPQGRQQYVAAALNADIRPSDEQLADMPAPRKTRHVVGIVLYPGFEVLDVYGPLEMWAYAPGFEVALIAEEAGPVRSAQGTETVAAYGFDNAPKLDILMVPGGYGTRSELDNPKLLDFLVRANEQTQFTSSVCTGSALLARAGLLDGHRATSNKRFFSLAEAQSDAVEWVPEARWVESGKMFTSSGVSAGMDMALGLVARIHGKMAAMELASAIEYVWHDNADNDPFAEYVERLTAHSAADDQQLVKSWPESGALL
ncbi:MAG: DJ-1/PfpI family protein, partial [Nevskiales bacterium]